MNFASPNSFGTTSSSQIDLTNVSRGSLIAADMTIHKGKTKNMIVERQDQLKPPTVAEILETEAGYKHECEFCDRCFKTKRGLNIHKANCSKQHGLSDEEFEIKKINAAFGTPKDRWFRVEWVGHSGKDNWDSERSLIRQGCEASIKTFWDNSNSNPSEEFIADPDDVWRCWTCGRGFRSAPGLKCHVTRTHPARHYFGSTADKDTRNKKHAEAQEKKCHVTCEDKRIENVWVFKYLGSRFRADGSQTTDVKARIGAATSAAGKMRAIWARKSTPLKLKMQIYKSGVCSRLTYGSETWRLDATTCKMLNGANSKLVARITHRTPHEEASAKTQTFDIVLWIRARRLQWVGHIIRIEPVRMVQQALRHIAENREEGDLLMDIPPSATWSELQALAADRDGWRRRVHSLRYGPKVPVTIVMNDSLPGCKATLRSSNNKPAPKSTPKLPTSPTARRYIARDAHEAFFRPAEKGKRKRSRCQPVTKRRKTKNAPLTNKQRQAWARDHYELHHGAKDHNTPWMAAAAIPSDLDIDMTTPTPTTPWAAPAALPTDLDLDMTTPSPTTTTPLTPDLAWSPQILGHHKKSNHFPNTSIPITPTKQFGTT